MKTEQFLQHHGIKGNPFREEDAQTDTVFKRQCLFTIHHPAWNKFFGNPTDPSTALVFGEKGSGKTALRLQATAEFEDFNQGNPPDRVFVISYDDFNPYLDHYRAAIRAADPADVLRRWQLQDHMDAILSLGVTQLVDLLTTEKVDLSVLSLDQRRDLLLLAALYDASTGAPLEPAPPPLRIPPPLEPSRLADRLWHDAGRDCPDRRVSVPAELECSALAACSRSRRLDLLGLAAAAGRVVCPRHSQGAEGAQPRFFGPALGAALVQAHRARRTTPADPGTQSRGTLRIAAQVPGRARHSRLRRHHRADRPGR